MKLTEAFDENVYIVDSYTEHSVTINGRDFSRSTAVSANNLIENWVDDAIHVDTLLIEHFEKLFEIQPEVIILSTGDKTQFPPIELRAAIMKRNIGLEVMDTGAACRTYNVLLAEGRRVLLAILL